MKRELAALSLLVVTGTLSFLGILYAVGYFGPSIEVEDTGGREVTTSTSFASAPGEGWAALPSDHAVAAAIPRDVPEPPAPTTSTTMAPVLAPPAAEVRPSPDPAPVAVQGGDSIEALICSYGWDCGRALAIFRCESGLNPAAVSPGGDLGIAQIHWPVHAGRALAMGYTQADMLTPGPNLAVAWAIWSEVGWRAWSCAR